MKNLTEKMDVIMNTVGDFPFALNSNPEAWIYEGEESAGVDFVVFENEEDVQDAVAENWLNMNFVEKSESFWFDGAQYDYNGNIIEND